MYVVKKPDKKRLIIQIITPLKQVNYQNVSHIKKGLTFIKAGMPRCLAFPY